MENRYIGVKLSNRYNIVESIGVGGMAYVFKAFDELTDSTVAVKILKEEYLHNEEFLQRFRNEARAISKLNHKNIVKVYDVGYTDNMQYIVMEYIEGITLNDYISQEGTIGWKETVHFSSQILKALQHAHEKGIIHRDIKPQNIMLLENGDIKVTDFGIASVAGFDVESKNNRTIGSVHYMSPEQCRGSQTDARTDIYSVGVMMYEMLTGSLPFDGKDTVSIAVMHMQADPEMPRRINPSIPEGLEEITMQAMQKDPAYRYQSAADMLMDIDDFKRDPDIKFEYRYMTDDSPTRYIEAIHNTRRMQEEEVEREKSPVIPVLAGIALAFVMVALVMMLLVLDESKLFEKNNTGTTVVPNFIGQNYLDVTNDPQYKFQWMVEWEFSNDYAENMIINQRPLQNKTVLNNTKFTLIVSKGVERLIVPDYDGLTYSQYSEECIKLNIIPKMIEVYSDTVPANFVVNTNPRPRADISVNDTVEIYVSAGLKPTELIMPNCQNIQYLEANAKLQSMGDFKFVTEYTDSEKPEGTILSQTPAAGTSLMGDETISFEISNGKAKASDVIVSFDLPAGLNASQLRVEIKINDETVYSESVDTAATKNIAAKITGSGSSKKAYIYLSGSLYATAEINFTTSEVKNIRVDENYQVPTTAPAAEPTAAPDAAAQAEPQT